MTALLPAIALLAAADAVFLEHSSMVTVTSESTAVEISSEIVIPITSNGVARYSRLSVPFTRGFDSVRVTRAETRPARPGRSDASAFVTESPRASLSSQWRLESSFRELLVDFQGVETGDTLLIEIERRVDRLPMGPFYSYSFFFQGRDSVASSRFELRLPPGMDVLIWGSDAPEPVETESSTGRTMVWRGGAEPGLESLPFRVPVEEEAARVVVAGADAAGVSAGLSAALDPGLPDQSCLEELDSIILAEGPSPVRLCSWISRNIVYQGAEIGTDPGYTPQPPSVTLSRGSGVCRDMAVLLVALLRRAGLQAWPVLTGTSARLDPLVGSRSFGHMTVLAIDCGDSIYLDPSLPYAAPGAGSLPDGSCLPLVPGGRGLLQLPDGSSADTVTITVRGILSASLDTLSATVTADFAGGAENLWRGMMSSLDGDRRGEALRILFGALPGSSLELVGDPGDADGRISVTGAARFAVPVLAMEGTFAVRLPGLEQVSQVGSRAASLVLSRGDGRAVLVETPLVEVLHLSVALPEGCSASDASAPEPSVGSGYRSECTVSGDSLRLEERAGIGPSRPSAAEVADLEETFLLRACAGARTFILGYGG